DAELLIGGVRGVVGGCDCGDAQEREGQKAEAKGALHLVRSPYRRRPPVGREMSTWTQEKRQKSHVRKYRCLSEGAPAKRGWFMAGACPSPGEEPPRHAAAPVKSLSRDVDPSVGKLVREGRSARAEFLVVAVSVTPHDHREARRTVQDGHRVMLGDHVIRDALARAGEERHGPRWIGTRGAPSPSLRVASSRAAARARPTG